MKAESLNFCLTMRISLIFALVAAVNLTNLTLAPLTLRPLQSGLRNPRRVLLLRNLRIPKRIIRMRIKKRTRQRFVFVALLLLFGPQVKTTADLENKRNNNAKSSNATNKQKGTQSDSRKSRWDLQASYINPHKPTAPTKDSSHILPHNSIDENYIARWKENFDNLNIPQHEYFSLLVTWVQSAGCAQDHKLISNCLDFIIQKLRLQFPILLLISVTTSRTYIIFQLGNFIRILLMKLMFEDQAEVLTMGPVMLTNRTQSLITIPPVRITIVPMMEYIL